ncbi:uncharacterized protein PHACADRAFT_206056 [Phanerochaete carnosa HHB-10118-sp]|uniref:Uncharacterized protein n=1 Tax=Phanerochaete carnosa (strain HHB-10118-sp) TaxID=650164 RepID=K5W7E0_PHACS|nr:uncharacterized protein PHACADRAFT_206056 [Phanerochaete carnosa HHB-10118-sp]EKM59843.1 hypothetical protein PHACADRAFT_206056 [Phanerochaete carnosa HHB-10118-sp]
MAPSALILPPVTPQDYHRIISPSLNIPSDPQTSIPVGLLACQRDSLLRELATTVVSSRPAEAPPQPKRAKKDKSSTPPTPASPLLEVLLHDTVLFPEGVAEVKRAGGHAVHYVKVGEKSIEGALHAFTVGREVGVRLGEAGLQRRLDHIVCEDASQEGRLTLPLILPYCPHGYTLASPLSHLSRSTNLDSDKSFKLAEIHASPSPRTVSIDCLVDKHHGNDNLVQMCSITPHGANDVERMGVLSEWFALRPASASRVQSVLCPLDKPSRHLRYETLRLAKFLFLRVYRQG